MKELDKFKEAWKQVAPSEEEEKAFAPSPLAPLASKSYYKTVVKIALPQIPITLLYGLGIVFFISFQHILPTATQQLLANVSIVLLVITLGLSWYSIYQFYKVGKMTASPAATLQAFQKSNHSFQQLRRIILALQILLFALAVALVPLVYSEELTRQQIGISFAVGCLLVLAFAYKMKQYYHRQLERNEALLRQLGQEE